MRTCNNCFEELDESMFDKIDSVVENVEVPMQRGGETTTMTRLEVTQQ